MTRTMYEKIKSSELFRFHEIKLIRVSYITNNDAIHKIPSLDFILNYTFLELTPLLLSPDSFEDVLYCALGVMLLLWALFAGEASRFAWT